MRTKITILAQLFSLMLLAQSKNYQKAMEKNVAILDTAQASAGWLQAANAFERIANAEKNQWLPFYYTAFATAMNGYREENKPKLDDQLDKAIGFIKKADSLKPGNSEVSALYALLMQLKMSVDPQKRWMVYGMQAGQLMEKAIGLDSLNPRPVYLKATSTMYTPEQFGGGKEKALPMFEKATMLFDKFKPESTIAPHWGKKSCAEAYEKCKQM